MIGSFRLGLCKLGLPNRLFEILCLDGGVTLAAPLSAATSRVVVFMVALL
jgi:hypothetical protein